MPSALDEICARLTRRMDRLPEAAALPAYRIPGFWLDPYGSPDERRVVPEEFLLARIAAILALPPAPLVSAPGGPDPGVLPGDWSRYAVAYNLFVRLGAAWDHDGDGTIAIEPDRAGWRETGTFLKAITLLPFIKSLGCNTVHLLPVTAIGRDGRKGTLGSPYAIRDPYALDPTLAEPALSARALDLPPLAEAARAQVLGGAGPSGSGSRAERDVGEISPADVALQFAALVEAAHHLGLRVVAEFVFRTAAKDAAWAATHPEWFYWIREDVRDRLPGESTENAYGMPIFRPDELADIYARLDQGDRSDLPAPHAAFRRMFLPPPRPEDVALIDGRWRGSSADPETEGLVTVRIPGAFADMPPDSDQPPWTDVTYLRLYDHPAFNYIAYNTVRMYDCRLAQPEHAVQPLWDHIAAIIPYYQQSFGIDGVMIDMGHALPPPLKQQIVRRARELDPDFALWAEDFTLQPASRAEGYNVVLGPFMQGVRDPARFRVWLSHLAANGAPVPFMAAPENHNCPRAVTWPGGPDFSLYAAAAGAFLPAIPYIYGGFELGDPSPTNTGFDFTPQQAANLPAEALPLFSAGALSWTNSPNLVVALRRLLGLRQRYRELVVDPGAGSLTVADSGNPPVLWLLRRPSPRDPPNGADWQLGILANSDTLHPQPVQVTLSGRRTVVDLLSGSAYALDVDGRWPLLLAPGQVIVFENSEGPAPPASREGTDG